MRIGILLDWMNPNIEETVRLLHEKRALLSLIYPDVQLIRLAQVRVEDDLYLIKSGTESSMSLAGALHALGAMTLNPYPTVAMMRNKIIVTRILQEAGVPTPETFLTHDPQTLAPLLDNGPLILKPYQGSRGEGIRVLRDARDLENILMDGPILAQRYHAPDGRDHKIFRIGERLFGVKRIWPLRTYEDKIGEPFTLTPEMEDIALRVGQAFGIDLYGLDIVFSQGMPYVVDVNKFGSYMGVPGAPRYLAEYVLSAAERAMRGEYRLTPTPAAPAYPNQATA